MIENVPEMPDTTKLVCGAIGTPERALIHVAAKRGDSYSTSQLQELLDGIQGDNPVPHGRTYARGTISTAPVAAGTFIENGTPKKYSLSDRKPMHVAQEAAATLIALSYGFSIGTQVLVGDRTESSEDRLSPTETAWNMWHYLSSVDIDEPISARKASAVAEISLSSGNMMFNRLLAGGVIARVDDDTESRFFHSLFMPVTAQITLSKMPPELKEVSRHINFQSSPFTAKDIAETAGYVSKAKAKKIANDLDTLKKLGLIHPLIETTEQSDFARMTKRGKNLVAAMLRFYDIAGATADEETMTEASELNDSLRNQPDIAERVLELSIHRRTDESSARARQEVLEHLGANPGSTAGGIVEAINNISIKTVYKILSELNNDGLINSLKVGRNKFWGLVD